jgi:hypothetical protein
MLITKQPAQIAQIAFGHFIEYFCFFLCPLDRGRVTSTPATLPLAAFHTADSGTMHEENVKTLKESTTPMLDIIRLFCQLNRYAFNYKSADIHTVPRDDFRLFSTSNLWGLLCFVVFL